MGKNKLALVRHANCLFVTGPSLKVPIFTIVVLKAFGLGSMAPTLELDEVIDPLFARKKIDLH